MRSAVRVLACVFAALTVILALGGTIWILASRNASPVLIYASEEAALSADRLFETISAGKYGEAEKMLLGNPAIGMSRDADSKLGRLIWHSYQESLTFTAQGDCFATDQGVGRQYTVRYLDLSSVTANLRDYATQLLEIRVSEATDVSELYDENNEYREDVVMDVLCDAARRALKQDARYVEYTFTVNMVYRGGKWLAIPDGELLEAITGGLAG